MPVSPVVDDSPVLWPIRRLTSAFAAGDLSPVDVTREALDRIQQRDRLLHAFVTVTPELASAQAHAAAVAYRRGESRPFSAGPYP